VQNNIGIDDRDVPIENSIEEKSRILVPYSHSGSVLVFKMPRTRSVSGSLRMMKDGRSRPVEFALFSLDVGGVPIEVPTGRNGDFYFENVPAGTYRATMELAGRPCRFELIIPVSDESFLRLPDVPTCSIP
jgi:outer membrane usher protein